jgi:hypothetical protein
MMNTSRKVFSIAGAISSLDVLCLLIFGPKRDEVTRDWRKLHNEEFSNLYSSLIIIRVIKQRMMRWTAYVARMGEKLN